MATLLLIRHGRTNANATGVLAGRTAGVELDEVGIETAELLGKRLSAIPIVQVVASPLERTKQTASLTFGSHIPIDYEHGLIECDYGDWQGKDLATLAKEDLWKIVQKTPDQAAFPNGESMTEMFNRSVKAIRAWDQRVTAEHGNDAIWAAVSHGDVIKSICADALGLPLRNFQSIMVEPASVSIIHYGEHGSSVRKINDTGDSWLSSIASNSNKSAAVGGETGAESKK